jgi:hypothetical protein
MMPTSSERLNARANAYFEAATAMEILAENSDSVVESEEYQRLADKLWAENERIMELSAKREEKEQGYEHRRKQG